jgi:DNA-binding GntR family transcriptional regulator
MAKILVDEIEASLRKNITSGVFTPSSPLRMEPLKERYDVGFSPIREALSRILADGLVELEPNRGFRVAPLTREDLLDIATARIAVETAAVRRAIELGDDRWEAEVVGALHRFGKLSGMERFDDEQKLAAWEEAHDGLHAAIISACGSPRLLSMQTRYQEQHLRYRRLIVIPALSGDTRARVAEHERLVGTVLARDADTAVKAIERHMMITVDALAAAHFWD